MASGLRYGVEVRRAVAADAPEVARLLAQSGLPITPNEAADRLEAIRTRADGAVLVAAGYGGLSGIVAVHWAPVLHAARPVAVLTTLVVDAEERRRGFGRLLLKAASQAARSAGCDMLEIAPGGGAAFCRATGFTEVGPVFERSLRKRGAEG